MPGKPYRKDKNHNRIVNVLHRLGFSWMDMAELGDGRPDGLAGRDGVNFLCEIKNPETAYGRKGLSDRQKRFAERWRGGPVYVLSTPQDCTTLLNGDREALLGATQRDDKKPAGGSRSRKRRR